MEKEVPQSLGSSISPFSRCWCPGARCTLSAWHPALSSELRSAQIRPGLPVRWRESSKSRLLPRTLTPPPYTTAQPRCREQLEPSSGKCPKQVHPSHSPPVPMIPWVPVPVDTSRGYNCRLSLPSLFRYCPTSSSSLTRGPELCLLSCFCSLAVLLPVLPGSRPYCLVACLHFLLWFNAG